MTSLKRNRILVRSIATLLAFDVAAQASLWDGGGANALWSTPANWDGNFAPESPSFLEFDGTVGLNSTNDLIGFIAEGISFLPTAGAFTLSGEAITLRGSVINETALEQKLNFNGIHLIGGFNVNTGAGTINFAGPITTEDGGVHKNRRGHPQVHQLRLCQDCGWRLKTERRLAALRRRERGDL